MKNKRQKLNEFLFVVSIFSGLFLWFSNDVSAATINAISCSYADVSAAITSANSGDIVNVPAGTCTWTSQLLITKGISFMGAGVGVTNITFSGSLPAYTRSFKYLPTDPSADEVFRMAGFSFDLGDLDDQGIAISNTTEEYALTKIRIDHNEFNNPGDITLTINGPIYGVVDNNVFNGGPLQGTHIDNYGQDTCADWSYFPISHGDANNLYYEDNVFNGQYGTLTSCGHGGKYVYRYNNLYTNRPSGSITPIFDMHGNQTTVPSGSKGGEIYGNEIDNQYVATGATMIGLRGGEMLAFGNKLTNFSSGMGSYAREEFDNGIGGCSPLIEQQIKNTYFWNNRNNGDIISFSGHPTEAGSIASAGSSYFIRSSSTTSYCTNGCYIYGVRITGGTGAGQFRGVSSFSGSQVNITSYTGGTATWDIVPDNTSTYEIVSDCCDNIHPDQEFFEYEASFNGTAGVGCGPLANRPETCTPGVGYWATNQSCSTVSDVNVGANPAEPISGMLYKCSATNTWTAYYAPYIYPHPFRTDCVGYPALCDNGSALQGDLNSDGTVNIFDYNLLLANFGNAECGNVADINVDCTVNIFDYNILLSNFGQSV